MKREKIHSEAQEKLKEKIVLVAVELFLKDGIQNVLMTDIAKGANVGVASCYRYFGTKKEIVIKSGIEVWRRAKEMLTAQISSQSYDKLSGLEQIESLFVCMKGVLRHHGEYLLFLNNFDAFIASEKITSSELMQYDEEIMKTRSIFFSAFQKGVEDNSIRLGVDFDSVYFTITHAMIALLQKLISRGGLVQSDNLVNAENQLDVMIEMSINYIKS